MTILVGIPAVLFLLMGLIGLIYPPMILEPFGTQVTTTDGRNEVRAVYGGYGVAMAVALLLGMAVPRLGPGMFLTVALAMTGMVAGRLFSAFMDRRAGLFPWLGLSVEAVVATMLLVAYRWSG